MTQSITPESIMSEQPSLLAATVPALKSSPCESPCDSPCGEPCDDPCSDYEDFKPGDSVAYRFMKASLYNALDIAFDEVRKEPKKILMIGGCRQREFARHIALLLPAADISLVDPDGEQVASAKAEICCRFKFIESAVERTPFDNEQFDLVIAHNLPELVTDWRQALREIQRITTRNEGNVMVSLPRPGLWKSLCWLPGMQAALRRLGVSLAAPVLDFLPSRAAWLKELRQYAPVTLSVAPFPFHWDVLSLG